jgi:hypothetical protein
VVYWQFNGLFQMVMKKQQIAKYHLVAMEKDIQHTALNGQEHDPRNPPRVLKKVHAGELAERQDTALPA